jgi:hypothetical protein
MSLSLEQLDELREYARERAAREACTECARSMGLTVVVTLIDFGEAWATAWDSMVPRYESREETPTLAYLALKEKLSAPKGVTKK